jgi:hypothetical protein
MRDMGDPIVLPVARARAAGRALVWSVPAGLLGVTSFLIYTSLHFVPSGVSNRLVDYSVALISLPIPLTALWSVFKGGCWLLLSLWPVPVGVFADERTLTLRLGPFGTRSYDAARMDIRYPFELSQDDEGGGFEAFLPEEEQRMRLLPRILHPNAREPLNRVILRFVQPSEEEAVRSLRPLLDYWRTRHSERSEESRSEASKP